MISKLSKCASGMMFFIILAAIAVSCKAASTVVAVTPSSMNVTVGQTFTVNVTIDYAANLWAFQFDLTFDKTKLAATALDDGGYLNPPTTVFANSINNTTGVVSYSVSTTSAAKTGGSPPPLATIHFKAIAAGISSLHLTNTILVDNATMTIPSTTSDGQVTITGGEQPRPVGGIWEPVNIMAVLSPWICLSLAIAASGALFGLFRKRLNR